MLVQLRCSSDCYRRASRASATGRSPSCGALSSLAPPLYRFPGRAGNAIITAATQWRGSVTSVPPLAEDRLPPPVITPSTSHCSVLLSMVEQT